MLSSQASGNRLRAGRSSSSSPLKPSVSADASAFQQLKLPQKILPTADKTAGERLRLCRLQPGRAAAVFIVSASDAAALTWEQSQFSVLEVFFLLLSELGSCRSHEPT